MEWFSDYMAWCLDAGFVGIAALLLPAALVAIASLLLLTGAAKAGQAVAKGWREAGTN